MATNTFTAGLTEVEREQMTDFNEALMPDTARILRWDPTDVYEETETAIPAYTPDAETIKAGLKPLSREIVVYSQVRQVDGQLRLPLDTVLDSRDRVLLLTRHGRALTTPLLFDLLGAPVPGPSGLVVLVEEVTDSEVPQ